MLFRSDGWPEGLQDALYESEYNSVQAIAEAQVMELTDFLKGNRQLAEQMVLDAREYLQQLREMTQTRFGDDQMDEEDVEPPQDADDAAVPDGEDAEAPAAEDEAANRPAE